MSASPGPTDIDWRSIFLVVDIVVGIIGIGCNILLLYLITTQSPSTIKVYRLLLMNTASNDMLTSIMMILLVPRVIGHKWTFIVASRGFCRVVGREFCFVGTSIFFATFSHFLLTLLVSFVYRYYVIKNSPPSSWKLILIIVTVSIPSCLSTAFFVGAFPYNNQSIQITKVNTMDAEFNLLEEISKFYSSFDLRDEVLYGFVDIRDWRMTYILSLIVVIIIPLYSLLYIMRRIILNYLRKQATSQKGIKIQKEILKVLTCQAGLPVLFFITIVMFIICQTTLWTHPLLECSIFLAVSLIPILSSMISIFFVRPYRLWVVWHFGNLFKSEQLGRLPPRPGSG